MAGSGVLQVTDAFKEQVALVLFNRIASPDFLLAAKASSIELDQETQIIDHAKKQ